MSDGFGFSHWTKCVRYKHDTYVSRNISKRRVLFINKDKKLGNFMLSLTAVNRARRTLSARAHEYRFIGSRSMAMRRACGTTCRRWSITRWSSSMTSSSPWRRFSGCRRHSQLSQISSAVASTAYMNACFNNDVSSVKCMHIWTHTSTMMAVASTAYMDARFDNDVSHSCCVCRTHAIGKTMKCSFMKAASGTFKARQQRQI